MKTAKLTDRSDSTDLSYRWHVHTRQNSENVGVVASYTGANVQGLWDTEQLRFNDFYGSIGWEGFDVRPRRLVIVHAPAGRL